MAPIRYSISQLECYWHNLNPLSERTRVRRGVNIPTELIWIVAVSCLLTQCFVAAILHFALMSILYVGLGFYIIHLVRGAPTSLGQVFAGFSRWLSVLAYLILAYGAMLLGFLALVLPGIFLSICFLLTPFILIDGNLPAAGAMGASFRAVMRLGWWRTFALYFLIVIIMFVLGVAVALAYGIIAAFFGYNGEDLMAGISGVLMQSDVGIEWLRGRAIFFFVFAPFIAYLAAVFAAVYEQARINEERRQDQA